MRITRKHALGKEEVRRRVDQVAADLRDQFNLRSDWQGDALQVTGSGVNGQIAVSDEAVDIEVTLGFSLMLMQAPIRSAIEEAMDRHLG